jgi:poly(A) polymerase
MIPEAKTDPFITGHIDSWGDVDAEVSHHSASPKQIEGKDGWWRFVPDVGLLIWGRTPQDWESMSVEQWLHQKGYFVKIRSTVHDKLKLKEVIKTLKGTQIKRFQNKVGKQVGPQLYVHRKYAAEIVPNDLLKFAATVLKNNKPSFQFNSIMWNKENNVVRFDEAPDFDSAREPHVGRYIAVFPDGTTREGSSNNIWHHKWLWVKDDYNGFDVDKSKDWSNLWASKLGKVAKGTDSSFQDQLKNIGLTTEGPIQMKELLMTEASKDEAALDFLKKMVQSGPYRGAVFLAGGAVRDMVMGKVPKDLDLVVTNHGKDGGMNFARWLAQQMGNFKEGSNPVLFPTFGTAKVELTGNHNGVDVTGMQVESVFARKEVYTPGSRKPEVSPGTIEDDAFRRDFTVNSMMLDLTTGQVLDLTGKGRSDIKSGVIRSTSPPDEIFGQDALRMFRAIRFATKYNWQIEPETVEGIRKNLDQLVTNNTSKERIRDEINKMLETSNPRKAFELMRDLGLLPYIAKEFQQAVGMTQNVHHNQDVFDHTMTVLQATKPELIRRLIALFHDIGKVATRSETPTGVHFYAHEDEGAKVAEKIMRELKYPSELIDAVVIGVKNHMRLKQGGDDAVKLSDKALRKFKIDLGDKLEQLLDVIHADNISHADASAMPNQIENIRQRLEKLNVKVSKPVLPINGEDLKAMGLKPGPLFSKILSAVTDAWYSNPDISRDEAIAIAQNVIAQT